MALQVEHITFDCHDAPKLAAFWAAALGRSVDPDPQPFFASIGYPFAPGGTPAMLFLQVPEGKTVKNRMHIDLHSDDPAGDLDRVLSLGATVADRKTEWGTSWVVLNDPEGNEFCIAGA